MILFGVDLYPKSFKIVCLTQGVIIHDTDPRVTAILTPW